MILANFKYTGAPLLGFLAVLLLGVVMRPLFDDFDKYFLDTQFAFNRQWFPQPVSNDVVLVGINEKFVESIDEPLALSHQYLAVFLRGVSKAAPAVIGMDIALPEKRFDTLVSTKNPQLDFHRTLLQGLLEAEQGTKLVVAKVWDNDHRHFRNIQIDYASVLNNQEGQIEPVASALFCFDADRRIRKYPGKECQPDGSDRTFGSEVTGAMGIRRAWSGLINYQLGGEFHYIPIQNVLRLAEQGNVARLREWFAGKAILLGTVDDDSDMVDLPVPLAPWRPDNKRVPGLLAHAQEIRSMLNQGFIEPMSAPTNWACCFIFTLFWFHPSIGRKMLLLLICAIGVVLSSNVLLRHDYWLMPTSMICTGFLAWGVRSSQQAWHYFGERKRLKQTFAGYVSPQVLKEIMEGGHDARKLGSKVPVCVMFTDIRNFTTISEEMSPEAVVALLNRYFSSMTAIVHKHGGTVDKFIGDGMMAFFGAPNTLDCPERSALLAAQDMLVSLRDLNLELHKEHVPPLHIGVGLHSGDAVIGYIGSDERHEYTAIGDTVNIASRLEGLCKQLNYPIICSEALAKRLDDPSILDALGEHPIKGHSPVSVFGWRPAVE